MSERNGYEPGVPCWVDAWQDDADAAAAFYTQLFGWEAARGEYTLFKQQGRDVAGVGAPRPSPGGGGGAGNWGAAVGGGGGEGRGAGGGGPAPPGGSPPRGRRGPPP